MSTIHGICLVENTFCWRGQQQHRILHCNSNARRYGFYDSSIYLAQTSELLRTGVKYKMGGHPRHVKYCSWPKFRPRISRNRLWENGSV